MPPADAASSSSVELIGDFASRTIIWNVISSLRTQREVDELCSSYGVPGEFTARPAGELRMSSRPPPGHVCVYAQALQAGMRVPLHGFFCEVLRHYRLAPSQLSPNGWRNVAGFVVLCHSAGVQPSLPVFRHFFLLQKCMGLYHFRSKDASGVLFTGTPSKIKDWKLGYFFLCSPAPWPCPVEWGVPPKSSTTDPVLSIEEKESAAKLLRERRDAAIDLQTYLCHRNLAAAMIAATSPAPPPPCARTQSPRTPGSKGMDPSVYDVMKTMRAEKAAAQALAAAKSAKTEPGLSPLSGKKRNLEDANAQDGHGVSPSVVSMPPAARAGVGGSASGARSPPPGCSSHQQNQDGKPQQEPDRHDSDAVEWEAARKLLQDLVTPTRSRVFAAAKPSDVVASSYVAMLQAANYTSFSLGYAMELEEKLRDAAAEAGALRGKLDKAKAELAEGRKATVEAGALRVELEKAKAELAVAMKTTVEAGALRGELEKTAAELAEARKTTAEAGSLRGELEKTAAELAEVRKTTAEAGALRGELEKTAAELAEARKTTAAELESAMENVRRLAEHALEGYERGMEHMKRVALRLYPQIDAARLVVPPGGPPP